MKIKTGDNVVVLSGKDRGKTGKIVQVLRNKATAQSYVVVEGVNVLKKHLRAGRQGEKGQVIELPSPIHASAVAVIDPKTNKGTRVGYQIEGDTKKRVAKGSNEIIG
ncbi:MAG: 50S ribosomal protein L24 [Candidatus Magasanikbacteria bacterium]|nr:50S ribosomal protein L24 [Candidatus Magasanikbacteria bacterium]